MVWCGAEAKTMPPPKTWKRKRRKFKFYLDAARNFLAPINKDNNIRELFYRFRAAAPRNYACTRKTATLEISRQTSRRIANGFCRLLRLNESSLARSLHAGLIIVCENEIFEAIEMRTNSETDEMAHCCRFGRELCVRQQKSTNQTFNWIFPEEKLFYCFCHHLGENLERFQRRHNAQTHCAGFAVSGFCLVCYQTYSICGFYWCFVWLH